MPSKRRKPVSVFRFTSLLKGIQFLKGPEMSQETAAKVDSLTKGTYVFNGLEIFHYSLDLVYRRDVISPWGNSTGAADTLCVINWRMKDISCLCVISLLSRFWNPFSAELVHKITEKKCWQEISRLIYFSSIYNPVCMKQQIIYKGLTHIRHTFKRT